MTGLCETRTVRVVVEKFFTIHTCIMKEELVAELRVVNKKLVIVDAIFEELNFEKKLPTLLVIPLRNCCWFIVMLLNVTLTMLRREVKTRTSELQEFTSLSKRR